MTSKTALVRFTEVLAGETRARGVHVFSREAEARSAGVNVPIANTSAYSRLRLSEAARDEAVARVESEGADLAAAQHRVQ